ncbi:MAG TPA: regulatory protein RecX [Chitinophagaceae bacterium]|jgi:regulatory protein|nr:regulatory protein RecX [Chitinophagaceae bacterium]
MLPRKQLTREQALQKLRHYCAYQERSHAEVKEKAYSFGLRKPDVEELLSQLIQDDYLNEERFAIAYAGGKFRMKQWGRTKIKYALKQKSVSDYCIKKALRAIDETQYEQTLANLAQKKYASLKHEQYLIRKKKTIDFLLQKGFEPDLVNRQVEKIRHSG